jgi:lipopolysaccharide export system protein LptA
MIYSGLALLSSQSGALALPSDPGQPIEIEAATLVLDQGKGISTYSGNVVLTQGSIHIEAETLVVYMRDRKLDRLEALGTGREPASFRQRLPDGEETAARAGRIEYHAAQSRLILREQAQLSQGGNRIQSERIDYNTASNSLIAGQNPGQDPAQRRERVRIVIEPGNGNPGPSTEQKQP